MKKNLLELILLFVVVLGLPAFSAGRNAKEIPIHDHKMMLVEAIGLISKEYQVYFTFDHELVKDIMVEYETREDIPVEEAISGVLSGTDLKFKLYDQRFVILYQDDARGLESLKTM